ncbi:alpha/beta hydrolase [Streptomyces sp. LX-29]|uniref:alpha/beta fold hydrolase n=1 Tax=Streptomyces sp. LX-29 TaxID=2900152 RepID=UPI00240E8494|nr:alpha/beta hydrolase [Streptomyces sp. LX-29]WFB05964.1 alpha/beta hydrolase [Streptomyces sp. LX-29]
MAVISAEGVELNVERLAARRGTTDPPTVVFIHGMLIDTLVSGYLTLGPTLAAAGFDVVMYDQRGHGRSERLPSGYTLDDFVGDLDVVLDRLAVSGPVHLVGHSFGGTIAFHYAARRPDRVATVSVIESEPATDGWSRKMALALPTAAVEFARGDFQQWVKEEHSAYMAQRVKAASHLLNTSTVAQDIPASRVLDQEHLRSLRCPVLAIYGSESELADQEPWLKSLISTCRTVVVPDQQHWVLLAHPRMVCDLIIGWVREHHRARPGEGGGR